MSDRVPPRQRTSSMLLEFAAEKKSLPSPPHVCHRLQRSSSVHSSFLRTSQRDGCIPGTTLCFSTLSLWTVWLVCTFTAFTSQVLSDVFQSNAPDFPLVPVILSASFLANASALFSILLGLKYKYPYFRVYQPFAGGERFVALQAVGWCSIVASTVGNVAYISVDHTMGNERYGFLSTVGILAMTGSITLAVSLWYFDATSTACFLDQSELKRGKNTAFKEAASVPPITAEGDDVNPLTASSTSRRRGTRVYSWGWQLRLVSRSPNREIALVLVFMAVHLLLCNVGAVFSTLARPAAFLALLFLQLNGALIHLVIGWRWTPGYRLFMPVQQTWIATVVQAVMWVMYTAALYLSVWVTYAGSEASPLMFGLLALGSLVSLSSLLLFVRTMSFQGLAPGRSLVALYGGFVLSATSLSMGCAVVAFAVLLRQKGLTSLCGQPTGPSGSRQQHMPQAVPMCDSSTRGFLLCQALSAVFMLFLPPFTHLTGRVIFGDCFGFFQPFRGSRLFVSLQALGWTCFGLALLLLALHITADDFFCVLASATLSFMSQLLIQGSIQAFERTCPVGLPRGAPILTAVSAPYTEDSTVPSADAHHATSPAENSTIEGAKKPFDAVKGLNTLAQNGHHEARTIEGQPTTAFTAAAASQITLSSLSSFPFQESEIVTPLRESIDGEMITSLLLGLASIVLRLIVDVAHLGTWSVSIPSVFLLSTASVTYAISVPLAHISGRNKGIPIFQPFSGSGSYIALQAIGWTLYAAVLIISVLAIVMELNDSGIRQLLPRMQYPAFWFTLEGFLHLIPLILVCLSIVVESRYSLSEARKRQLTLESFTVLRSFLHQVDEEELCTTPGVHKKQLIVALDILADLALTQVGLSLSDIGVVNTPGDGSLSEGGGTKSAEGDVVSMKDPIHNMVEQTLSTLSFTADTRTRQGAATLLVLLLSIASASMYSVAAFLSSSLPTAGAAFATIGVSVSTITCVTLHCVYGTILHGHSGKYSFFMPFKGGQQFIALQTVGWVTYSGTVVVTLMSILEPSGYPIALVLGACMSVSSQVCILFSISVFDGSALPTSYVESNAESIVALLTFIAAFLFAHLYSEFSQLLFLTPESVARDPSYNTSAFNGYYWRLAHSTPTRESAAVTGSSVGINVTMVAEEAMQFRRSRVPLVVAALSIAMAVPLVIVSLNRMARRSVEEYSVARMSADDPNSGSCDGNYMDDAAEETEGLPSLALEAWRRRRRPSWVAVAGNVLQIFAMLSLATIPLLLVFTLYFTARSYDAGVARAVRVWWPTFFLLVGAMLLFSSLRSFHGSNPLSRRLRDIGCAACTMATYSMSTFGFIISYTPVILLPFRSVGAYYFAFTITTVTIFGGMRLVRKTLQMGVFATVGYVAYNQACRIYSEGITIAYVTSFYQVVVDLSMLGWWLWYMPLYDGDPQETGTQRSMAFTRFARKYLFAEVSRYFDFKIIVDAPSAVHMHDPRNQYLFSFHPHGVFPGTALFASLTEEWERQVGLNSDTYVSTHCASIVFNVPFIRDFNLRLGARAVTRSGIGRSLEAGNSVIIVTGGQAEMLHTSCSATEMHLITYHNGFVRIAMKHNVPLVPALCFAENNVMNLVQFPRCQKYTLHLLGFPFPMLPYGRWFLPLPMATPLRLVIGNPVYPQPGSSPSNSADVEKLAEAYFAEVKALFYKHREAAGYPNMELFLHSRTTKT